MRIKKRRKERRDEKIKIKSWANEGGGGERYLIFCEFGVMHILWHMALVKTKSTVIDDIAHESRCIPCTSASLHCLRSVWGKSATRHPTLISYENSRESSLGVREPWQSHSNCGPDRAYFSIVAPLPQSMAYLCAPSSWVLILPEGASPLGHLPFHSQWGSSARPSWRMIR